MLNEQEKQIVRELQAGLPLVNRPFLEIATRLNITEKELLAKIKDFLQQRVLRRLGAAVRHQDLGFNANALVIWKAPEDQVETVGRKLATFPEVTHCYQRACPPSWKYNLFTVVHGQSEDECLKKASRLAAIVEIDDYLILFSKVELKKSSMSYFV